MISNNFIENNEFSNLDVDVDIEFFVLSTSICNSARINTFCCIISSTDILSEKWKEISDNLNYEYFSKYVPSDFERWNNYLVFVCLDSLPEELKYEIENDKFYMRKIVLDLSQVEKPNMQQAVREILDEKLLLSNVNLSTEKKRNNNWNESLGDYSKSIVLEKISAGRDAKSKSMREIWLNKLLGINK
ncbi:ABC-three component system middle component 1 [Aliivibrio sifiae]|uniref:Uncharacterized protein n=1 Tax=Aliivibrio sifiae TaxID=566293 RepID=A0A2S7XDX1_9GAMM|nr:ABC-three component system middle component 1 [Aliivibrio sifiae]PQJ89362.1 hypothetical protein BTO22_07075 [Aliivibrio sifiae]